MAAKTGNTYISEIMRDTVARKYNGISGFFFTTASSVKVYPSNCDLPTCGKGIKL